MRTNGDPGCRSCAGALGSSLYPERLRLSLVAIACGLAILASAAVPAPALAGPPTHLRTLRTESLDIAGLNRACGVAIDTKGDVYASSAGEAKVNVYDPAHNLLTSIPDSNTPCGLAVDTSGNLYVSDTSAHQVVKYPPSEYPPTVSTAYAATTIDSSPEARGIAVDRTDNRLYVAEGNRVTAYNPNGTAVPPQNEVQWVRLYGNPTGGFFRLEFEAQKTAPIAWNAGSAALQAALEALPSIGAGNVSVTGSWSVEFVGKFADTRVELLHGDPSELTGGENVKVSISESVVGFGGEIGEGALTEAAGVTAYTSPTGDHYLWVADARGPAADELLLFSGPSLVGLKLHREIAGAATPDGSFEFGAAGAQLAVDPGNANSSGFCVSVAEQACTAGHVLVYDAGHAALDEFDASGKYLDRISEPEFADAEPSGIAIERSGGPGDGTIYLGIGKAAGAKLLAFSPLAAPGRAPLEAEPPSRVLQTAERLTTDPKGYLYVPAQHTVHIFGPEGSELTTFEDPHGRNLDIAVDSTGKVYVVEENEETHGDTVTYYTPSAYPPGPGTTYARHEPIAEGGHYVAVNPHNDHVFVADRSAGKGSPEGAREFDSAANGSGLLDGKFAGTLTVTSGQVSAIDVYGASGDVYFASTNGVITIVNAAGTEVLARIDGAGAPKGKLPTGGLRIAVDQSNGHVLAFTNPMGAGREYDASGAFVAEFAFPEPKGFTTDIVRSSDIAIDNACALHRNGSGEAEPLTEATGPTCAEYDPADGHAYIAFDDAKPETPDVWAFGPLSYGLPPQVSTGIASGLGGGGATLNGTVTPEGFEVEGCKFEYLEDAAYQHNLEEEEPPFASAEEAACEDPAAAEIGAGASPVAVHATLASLSDPEGRYRFRLCAANRFGEVCGGPGLFGPPEASTSSALPVLYTEATLRGEVEPAGLATSYRFEYRSGEGPYTSTPTQQLPAGEGSVAVQAPLTGLAEATTYSFHLVAESEDGTATGSERQLTTRQRRPAEPCPNAEYRIGLSANLPDCRAYELLTPPEVGSAVPQAPGFSEGSDEAGFNEWLATPRGEGAGERLSYFTPGTIHGFEGNGSLDGYRVLRDPGLHPAGGWRTEIFSPEYALAAPGIGGRLSQEGVSSDQRYSFWLIDPATTLPTTLAPGIYLQTPAGFEAVGRGELPPYEDLDALGRYISPGGDHVIFSSAAHLEPDAPPAGVQALYDRAAGSADAEVLSIPPAGGSPALRTAFESTNAVYRGAGEDGSAVVFKLGGALYAHRGGQTLEVAPSPATFAGISPDGERVYYADYAATVSHQAPASLYLCELSAGPCAGEGAHEPIEISPSGRFTAVDDEGAAAFFVAEGEGGPDLYRWDAATRAAALIAPLDPADLEGFEGEGEVNLGIWTQAINPAAQMGRAKAPARATPGGGVFVFQSHAKLSAYENEGAGEIYRFDPAAPAAERLLCVSCDPSGAPPSGEATLQTADFLRSRVDDATRIANITDDGARVFFESPDQLVPEDANRATDVYEWMARGTAGCGRADGCLALISSGQGEAGSYIFGMSADGSDVFLSTRERLVGSDLPGTPSIYDAREGGGIPEPAAQAPCQGDACQGSGSQAPPLGASATTGSGGGSIEEAPKRRRCPKGRRAVRRHGKLRCISRHRRHRSYGHRRHKRAHAKRGVGR